MQCNKEAPLRNDQTFIVCAAEQSLLPPIIMHLNAYSLHIFHLKNLKVVWSSSGKSLQIVGYFLLC